MSSEAPTLLTLPDVAMKHILERCDYESKQALRKTCWDLRNFIDDVKIDSHVEHVYVHVGSFEYSFTAIWKFSGCIRFNYCSANSADGWTNNGYWQHTFCDENFQDQFWRDFELFLKYNSKIASLYLQLDSTLGPENVNELLFQRIRPILEKTTIEVENLEMEVMDQKSLMDVLPFIKEKSLKSIEVYSNSHERLIELDEVLKLNQWKFAEKLYLWSRYVNAKIQEFAHFSYVTVRYEKFKMEHVEEVRKAFSQSPKLTKIRLFYSNGNAEDVRLQTNEALTDQFGQPNSYDYWYFKIQNSKQFLAVLFHYCISFERYEKEHIPKSAIVIE